MKMAKGILWVLFVVMLFGVAVRAETPDKIMENKLVEYVGICRLDKSEQLVFDDSKTRSAPQCIVGYEQGVPDERWIALIRARDVFKIVKFNLKTRKQVTLWSKGTT